MILRQTKLEDVSRVMEIINQAKSYFKENGIDQWQDGYPNEETIKRDIEKNEAYVLVDEDQIVGTCMVTIHGETAYNRIDGKWLLNSPYICVHRIAVDNKCKGKGLASTILDQAVAMYPDYHSVRMDTHNDNLSMQKFLTKYGFQHCGTITLASGALRRAYEKRI
ncbi:MAG: GNAT family N-acetyltransferase [Bacillota bacterium]|nr:GNAT family N-acetyltransferase [Bacillota bacterium]